MGELVLGQVQIGDQVAVYREGQRFDTRRIERIDGAILIDSQKTE